MRIVQVESKQYQAGYAKAWQEMQDLVQRNVREDMTMDEIINFMNAIIIEINYHELKSYEKATNGGYSI